MDLQVITGEKGKPLILLENQKFYKYRVLKSTSETCWCCVKKNCRAKLYTFGDETDLVFSKNTGEHDHEVLDKCVLNKQKVSNQVKRKAEDWICDRPAKIIHQELNSQKQCLETLTSKDIQYIRNNFGREKRKTFPKLPKSSVDVQNALNVLDIRTIKD
jgi:5-bromo-4-chloroindolyl phosphate hydrolysis protein